MKTKPSATLMWVIAASWLILISGGMAIVWGHSSNPGMAADSRLDWPAGSRISRPKDRPVLVMTLHPECACSQASLTELEELMAGRQNRMSVVILLCCPHGAPSDWMESSLAQRASKIPGVSIFVDRDNLEAIRFGAKTSGQTFLFDSRGRRLFAGGITDGRGHEGNNPGVEMIAALVDGKPALAPATGLSTPVFGCSLFSASSPSRQ